MTSASTMASPLTHSRPSRPEVRRAVSGSRCSARTRQPPASNRSATAPPIPPVAPITSASRLLDICLPPWPRDNRCNLGSSNRIAESYGSAIHWRMPGPNDWDLFQSLHAVLEAGTLSAAAKLRGLTQPTLGRHIETLEQRLGSPLFLRSPRGLQPTDLAMELKPHLHDMAAAASAAVRDASGAADSLMGSIRITASEIVGAEVLPPMLTSFRELHPGVVIELMLSNINDDLSRREADIAVRMTPPSQSSLVAKKVGEVTLGFYATAEYLERHGTP